MTLNCLANLHATSILVIFNNVESTFQNKKTKQLNISGHSNSYSFIPPSMLTR